MKSLASVIGEGAYGCVHKRPLECNKPFNYTNKISKVTSTEEAQHELKEYKLIQKIDKDKEFYLGVPEICSPKDDDKNRRAIEKCEDGERFIEEFDKLSLLIMKDGGINLDEYADQLKVRVKTPESTMKMELFWIEAHRLFLGLRAMIGHGILHQDLKPQNIVYNEKDNRLNFIDFGFMDTIKKVTRDCKESSHWLSEFHWSYPFEMKYLNYNNYMEIATKTEQEKQDYYEKIILDVKSKKNDSHINALQTAFSYLIPSTISEKEYHEKIYMLMEDYYETILYDMDPLKYGHFLKRALSTLDIYGVGFALIHLLNNSAHLIDRTLANDLKELFYSMITPSLSKRVLIDSLLDQYEDILSNRGILRKHHVHFDNHALVSGTSIPEKISNDIKTISKKLLKLSNTERKERAKKRIPYCKEGKEYNPKTGTCTKTCKPGYIRNKNFKCTKKKTRKLLAPV
jgi:serine/threonine protein kinase